MKSLLVCTLIVTVAKQPGGQTGGEAESTKMLISSLLAFQQQDGRDAKQREAELAKAIMNSAEPAHLPARGFVQALARDLGETLSGRNLPRNAVDRIATGINAVLCSAGVATPDFKQMISGVEKTLSNAGVHTAAVQGIAARLTAVGKDVRGPQDSPLLPWR